MERKRGEENIPSACDSAEGREGRRGRKGRGNAHLDLSAGRLYNYFSVPVCHTGARSRSRSIRALPATVIVPCKNLLCSLSLRGTFEWPRVSPLSTPSHSADASGRRHRHNHARSVRLFADRRSTTWRAPSTDRRVAVIAITAQCDGATNRQPFDRATRLLSAIASHWRIFMRLEKVLSVYRIP